MTERDRLIALILEQAERCPKCGSVEIDDVAGMPLFGALRCLDCGATFDPDPE